MVLVTGGSSGIGLAAAHKFAEAGAITIICGRDQDKLDEAVQARPRPRRLPVRRLRGRHRRRGRAATRFVAAAGRDHGGVDFLINNAGRSIRRAIESSYDRFHDFERTMQLNYFGSLRVTMGLLPGMVAKKQGPCGQHQLDRRADQRAALLAPMWPARPRWTPGRAAPSSEFADQGITFTTINMPLVRTPMIAPTKIYNNVPTLAPEEAADMIAQACIYKPVRIATRLGIFGEVLHAAGAARRADRHEHHLPHVPGQRGRQGRQAATSRQLSPEAVAMQQMMRGIHF